MTNRIVAGEKNRGEGETREARAIRHYRERRGDIVAYVDGVTFGVESGTEEGLIYRTNPEAGYCPCPDSELGHRRCWHAYYAEIHVAGKRSRGGTGSHLPGVRYGMVADVRVDGDERYFVYSFVHDGERWVRDELLAVAGYSLTAEREVRRLRAKALEEVA